MINLYVEISNSNHRGEPDRPPPDRQNHEIEILQNATGRMQAAMIMINAQRMHYSQELVTKIILSHPWWCAAMRK